MLISLLSFVAAASLLILAPGPDTAVVLRGTFARGRKSGFRATAGVVTGLTCWMLAAALGLSSLLRASQVGFDALRVAGGIYLIYLGACTLWRTRKPVAAAVETPPRGPSGGYLAGLYTNLLNPKVGIFFLSFMPAFVPKGVSVGWWTLLLGAIYVIEGGIWLSVVVRLAAAGAGWLNRANAWRRLEQVTGLVLLGFGFRLLTEAR